MKKIEEILKHDVAGDPMKGLKWTRKATRKIAKELKKFRIYVTHNTVARLLKQLNFSLRVNHKKLESGNKNPPKPKDRNRQLEYIKEMRDEFAEDKSPAISVDTKKKELIGNFKNNGKSWQKKAIEVNDHDFRSDAEGIAVPYGIYDTLANLGSVYVGTSAETPAFAVDCIELWWRTEGVKRYPDAVEMLILADCGGPNGARLRAFKSRIQDLLCDKHELIVTVCHYPPGSSKWNPIEHRLFSEISKNWEGIPLRNFTTALNYIRRTRTSTGLRVRARLIKRKYEKGEKISDEKMNALSLERHDTFPHWNYTLYPSEM